MKNAFQRSLTIIYSYKYYFVSLLLAAVGLNLLAASESAAIPDCSNPNVLEKLKSVISADFSSEKFSVNKVTSVFDIDQIEKASGKSRSCRAGLTIEGSELGNVNYLISVTAPGSKEKFTLGTSLD